MRASSLWVLETRIASRAARSEGEIVGKARRESKFGEGRGEVRGSAVVVVVVVVGLFGGRLGGVGAETEDSVFLRLGFMIKFQECKLGFGSGIWRCALKRVHREGHDGL